MTTNTIQLAGFAEALKTVRNILIFPHTSPDADTIGSSLAVYLLLKKQGYNPSILAPDRHPHFLDWLPEADKIQVANELGASKIKTYLSEADMFFFIDFPDTVRLGERLAKQLSAFADTPSVLIDHHTKAIEADYKIWDMNASSTAELIYDFCELVSWKKHIDKDVASCLYAGIVTDTGSFKFSTVTSKVHRIVADLLDTGIANSEIHHAIYDNNGIGRCRMLGYVLLNKLCQIEGLPVVYMSITEKEKRKFASVKGDTEGIVNYGLSIKGVDMSVILIQKGKDIKMSLRSVGNLSVAAMSEQYFNGGGHHNAAGGILKNTKMDDAILYFKEVITKYFTQANN